MRQLRDARLTIGAPRAIRSARSFGACSPAPARSRSWGSRRGRFRSRSMSRAAGCRASRWSGFPIRRSGNRASGCDRRSSTRASSSRCSGSPPTWRPPTCARRAPASTWRSRPRCWRPRGSLPPERLRRVALAGELALDGSIRPVPGVLAMAEAARELEAEAIAVPAPNAPRGGPRRRAEGRAAGPARAARSPGHRGRAARSPAPGVERRTAPRPRRRTSPTCGGSRTSATPWRWRPPAATAC